MASIKIKGDTSGSTTITAPATGSDETIELSTALASKLDLAGKRIIQVVRFTDTTLRSGTNITYADVTGMSVTITPEYATSGIIVMATGAVRTTPSGAAAFSRYRLVDGSTNAIPGAQEVIVGQGDADAIYDSLVLIGYDTPATTSAVSYQLQVLVADATSTWQVRNSTQTGQMFAIEVSA